MSDNVRLSFGKHKESQTLNTPFHILSSAPTHCLQQQQQQQQQAAAPTMKKKEKPLTPGKQYEAHSNLLLIQQCCVAYNRKHEKPTKLHPLSLLGVVF
jgi:hypothetical protein